MSIIFSPPPPLVIFLVLFNSALTISVKEQKIDYETFGGQRRLARNEQIFLEALLKYKIELERIISTIKNYTVSYTSSVLNPLKSLTVHPLSQDYSILDVDLISEQISKSPIMTFQLFQRLVNKLPLIEKQTKEHRKAETDLRHLLSRNGPILRVDESDLKTKAESLLYAVILYDLQPDDLEVGKLGQVETNSGLTEQHFSELAFYSFKKQFLVYSIKFNHKAREMIRHKEEEGQEVNATLKLHVNSNLERAINLHNKYFKPNRSLPFFFEQKVANLTQDDDKRSTRNNTAVHYDHFKKYAELCAVKMTKLAENNNGGWKNPPKCFLSSKSNLYWLLSPLKIEVHSRSPLIFQYYDVLTDSQLNDLMVRKGGLLERSKVVNYAGKITTESSRISASAYIDPEDEQGQSMARKVQLITGLKAMTEYDAEVLQLTNYVTGGHFVPHWDPISSNGNTTDTVLLEELTRRGDRIATFMFYISNVEEGGRTAFPNLGVTVEPVKGSALFWYNLYPDGTVDRRTMHGGCSVLIGSKWMSTKWIRSHSQMFLQKCDRRNSSSSFYDSYRLEY